MSLHRALPKSGGMGYDSNGTDEYDFVIKQRHSQDHDNTKQTRVSDMKKLKNCSLVSQIACTIV